MRADAHPHLSIHRRAPPTTQGPMARATESVSPPAADGGLSVIIPYRNGCALGAYYTGVFSLIPFLGILLAYGMVGPVALLLEQRANESTKILQCIKVTLLATLNGYAPAIAIEFGRKVLYSTERPTFLELEEHVKGSRA